MAATYSPQSLGIQAPAGGFQEGGWYSGRQYIGGSLGDVGVIHPSSSQQGAGQAVSAAVNNQSAAAQGVSSQQFNSYLDTQKQNQPATATPTDVQPNNNGGAVDPNASGGGAGIPGGIGTTTTPPIDLPGIYNSLYNNAGISAKEQQLADETQKFNDAQKSINDNPFLSEANRVGRISKLQTDYNNNVKGLQDDIATSKADIQTQLDLQTKQYDINSQASQQAMSQFNTLLSSGALDNLSGQDIANLTRSTGLSSGMIQAAVANSKQKNSPSQVIPYNDGVNQGFAVIDPKTGQIINKQVIAAAPPTKYNGGDTGGSTNTTPAKNKAEALAQLPTDFKQNKMTLGTAMSFYQQFDLTPQQIYNQYKVSGQYSPT